jgi:ABC-type phosphate/phosphonate transport system substrate-binding protein
MVIPRRRSGRREAFGIELKLHPERTPRVRVIETLGPSAIPPAVVSKRVPDVIRRRLRQTLLHMHADPEGRRILSAAMVECFVEVTDAAYDDIRRMAREAERVCLGTGKTAADISPALSG